MSNVSLTRVNQKLAQAKALIVGVDESALTPIHRNAIMEAAAFHLVCAYQHYLRELTEAYELKYALGVRTELDVVKAFEVAKKHPTEAYELSAFRGDLNSWLAQLHNYYDSLWQLPRLASSSTSTALINLVDVDAINSTADVNIATIVGWHSEFVSLVMRQRATSAEF